MPQAKLTINGQKEITIGEGVASIGRASDNTISLADDPNISRYHAEIETRGDDFYLVELGSSNGTTVGGERVSEEIRLKDGDLILLGGSAEINFAAEKPAAEIAPEGAANAAVAGNSVPIEGVQTPDIAPAATVSEAAAAGAAETAKTSKLPLMLAVAAIACGLAVVFVVAAVVLTYSKDSRCEAQATITSPENGETISQATDIEVEVSNADCVKRAIFVLDGVEIASADAEPYKASLDPAQFAELSDGGTHSLRIVLEDAEGNKIAQGGEVLLAFETLATPTPTPEPTETPTGKPTPKPQTGKISAIDVQEMSKRLVGQFSGSFNYKFDSQFLQEVQKKTSEYASEGYFARASAYRDAINVTFVQETSLDPALGYVLAMSRSQFKLQNQGNEEGLWRMTNDLVTANGYNGLCGAETLADAKQNCAARASSLYLKALVIGVFEGDVVCAVSTFGMSPQEASIWKSSLPADRADFWKLIKTPKQREEVVRFFAAGIVAENPQKFGLKKDRPISELYRNLVGK